MMLTFKHPLRTICVALAFSPQLALAQGGPPVAVAEVAQQQITQLIRATGSVTSPRQAMLSASVDGLIAEYVVDIGTTVAAGNQLVRLDDELAALQLQGDLARQAEADANWADARRRFAQAETLSRERGIIAATDVEALRAEVAARKAVLESATAAVQLQRAIVERHSVRAPFAGVVSERSAEVGEWANKGDPLLQLVATSDLQFDFRLSQDVYDHIEVGAPVTVQLDALPDLPLPGRVQIKVPVSNPQDRTFLLRVVAEKNLAKTTQVKIRPGMSARGAIRVVTGRTSVVVPRDSVSRYPDGRVSVWVVQKSAAGNVVKELPITTGLEFDGLMEVTTGLTPGLRIVVRGNESLQDGQSVEVL